MHLTGQKIAPSKSKLQLHNTSIQDVVDKAPDNSKSIYVIHIKEGTYHEIIRIPQCKTRLMFLEDGIGKTIITGDLSVQQPGINTMDSATIVVSGVEFIAQDLTIQNTAGPEAYQAVALRVDSDRSSFHRVAVLGYQDSLYAHTLCQFYRDCLIEGTIDFIFGNSAAIFQNCSIHVRVGRQGVADSTVTAHGRTDPAQTTGLVFYNCSIDGTAEYNCSIDGTVEYNAALAASRSHYRTWLGRPWKQYSRTIYIETFMGALVDPEGWKPWNGDYALATLYYGEFHSYGPGGNFSLRVGWSLQLTADEISGFSVQRFIQGTQWLPETNIPFDSHDLD